MRIGRRIRTHLLLSFFCGAQFLRGAVAGASNPPPGAATIEKPTFEVQEQSFVCPIQTGKGRKALVRRPGLYRLPNEAGNALNLGRKLNTLADNAVFIRAVDNLYTGTNAIWIGDLSIEGAPGILPPPPAQALIAADGRFRGLFRTELDQQFQSNLGKTSAPNWYFPKNYDVVGERTAPDGSKTVNRIGVRIELASPLTGPAEIRIGLNSNAPPGKPNKLTVFLNGSVLSSTEWEGTGYRVIRFPLDGGKLRDGANLVELLGDTQYSKYLDYVEVETNTVPALRDERLVVRADADCPDFSIPGAGRVVDITDAGNEQDVPGQVENETLRIGLRKGRLYYLTSKAEPLAFGPEVRLEAPPASGNRLIVVGPALSESAMRPFVEAKNKQGLPSVFVPYERIQDVYNGGIYGPGSLKTLVSRFRPEYLLIASGFRRDCRKLEDAAAAAEGFVPGVPAGFRHLELLTISDDDYTLKQTVAVGRIPARNPEELQAWVEKAANYVPSDRAILLAGRNYKEDFPTWQKNLLGLFPSDFLSLEGMAAGDASSTVARMMRAGARLVAYQGHGQSWELDQGTLKGKDGVSFPPSCWLLATCNSAYFYADYDVFLRDWLFQPSAGCVHSIAATGTARADVQDVMVKVFLTKLRERPDWTWGGMLNFLKRNVPVSEEGLKKPGLPDFFLAGVAEERKSVEVMMLLGDPSAPILPPAQRRAAIRLPTLKPGVRAAPPGALSGELTLAGSWSADSLAGLSLLWAPGRRAENWQAIAHSAPFVVGGNKFLIPAGMGEADGGPVQVRLVERRPALPETVWAKTQVLRESSKPRAPMMTVMRRYSYASGGFELTCTARDVGTFAEPKPFSSRFQLGRHSGSASGKFEVLRDSGWARGLRRRFAESRTAGAEFVRACISRDGVTGDWSPWRPLRHSAPEQAPTKTSLRIMRFPEAARLGNGLFVVPIPLSFGVEARFEVRDKASKSTILATGWLKTRRLAVDDLPGGNPKQLEVRGRLKEGDRELEWSDWRLAFTDRPYTARLCLVSQPCPIQADWPDVSRQCGHCVATALTLHKAHLEGCSD